MKMRFFAIMLILLFLVSGFSGCGLKEERKVVARPVTVIEAEPEPRPDPIENTIVNQEPVIKEEFLIYLPDWREIEAEDKFTIKALESTFKTCNIRLNKVAGPIDWYKDSVRAFVKQQGWRLTRTDPIEFEFTYKKGIDILTKTKAMRCDDHTFFVYFGCLDNTFDDKMKNKIFNSMECSKTTISSP